MPRVLTESVLIVFSVLLALALNEWRETAAERGRVAEARALFAEEIRSNRSTLAADLYLPSHRRMWARYRELARLREPTHADVGRVWADFPQGVASARLRDAAWRSLSRSEVFGRMNPRDLLLLAEIYREQEQLDDFHRAMYAAWRQASGDVDQPAYIRDQIRSTGAYLGDVVGAEERLLRRYDEVLRQIDRPAGRSP